MTTVGELLDGVHHLVDIQADETVLAASWRMIAANIGALLVQRQGAPVGIITERDILVRVVGLRRDPGETLVGDVMSSPFVSVTLETMLEDCERMLAQHNIRHLPVFAEEGPVAMISLRDLLHAETRLQRDQIRNLEQNLYRLH